MGRYTFLLDHDVEKMAPLFPSKRTVTATKLRLVADDDIMRAACERECIIVTANGDEFLKRILGYQRQSQKKECHETRGLLVLPSGFELQKRAWASAGRGVTMDRKLLQWNKIRDDNYYVKLNASGRHTVKRLPRCHYCAKNELND